MNIEDIKWFFDFSDCSKRDILEGVAIAVMYAIFFILLMLIPA